MRVLHITGDDDYHVLAYKQSGIENEEIIEILEKSPDNEHRFELEDGGHFDAKLYVFGEVDPKFIEFLESIKDDDDIKHEDWIVVD